MKRQPRIPRTVPGKSNVKAEQKKERTAADHFEMVKSLPCCVTGNPPKNDGHHLMRGVERGMGIKAAGRYTIPLRHDIHVEITPKGDPEAFLMERYGVDARALADALWSVSGDYDAMERAVIRAFQDAQRRMRMRHAAEVWGRLAAQVILFAKTEADLREWWGAETTASYLRRLKRHHPDIFERVTRAKDEHKAALTATTGVNDHDPQRCPQEPPRQGSAPVRPLGYPRR